MSNQSDPSFAAGGSGLFLRPPAVDGMRDALHAEWNQPPQPAADDPGALIEFGPLSEFFENFLNVVGLPAAIIGLDGRVLASSRWQRMCTEFHRVGEATGARCLDSDRHLANEMAAGKDYAIYGCPNGLTDCVVPLRLEGRHIANLFVGQVLLAPPDMGYFRRQQQDNGFDAESYFQALAEIPIISEDKLNGVLTLMSSLAHQIAQRSLAEQRARAAVAAVERTVQERTRELTASNERLSKIAARLPGVVFQFCRRPDGRYCMPYASDALGAMFGVEAAAIREDAGPIFAAIHTADLGALVTSIEASARDLSLWRQEFRVRRPDGTVRTLLGESVPERAENGSVLWHGFVTDITARKRTEGLLEARLRLSERAQVLPLHDLLVATLDEVCALTGSAIGFYHFLLPDEVTLSLQAWSTRTTAEFCRAVAENAHYDISAAGVWADCVRQRRSVVYNDYATLPNRRGMPEGHAEVRRLMSVPIFREGRVVAILGVGNKSTDYDREDLVVVETLADLAWDLAERKRSAGTLAAHAELIQRRYESLRALNDIAALPRGSLAEQVHQALHLGARHLGLPIGIVSRIEDERYTILQHCAPSGAPLANGQVFALGETYCVLTLDADDVVAIPEMGRSAFAGHPCYQAFRLEAYIGAPILVGQKRFGTVNFSSPERYSRQFDEGDVEFVRLLARWLGSVLERDQAEQDILDARDTAERRAAELASSNTDLEQFAYVASHDLRQPLRMVSSYLTLIERQYADRLDDEGREYINFARDGAVQMDKLIRDLLDYSRVGRHGKDPEMIDLAEAAAEGCHRLQVLLTETGAEVKLDTTPAVVLGNRGELERLFQNLIGNAVKYRAEGRVPRVTVGWRRQGGEWLVSVADNGIGIQPDYWQQIFALFRRLHPRHEYEGTGVGLAVCKKIIEGLGGRIWVDSTPGQGSTFLFTLPA